MAEVIDLEQQLPSLPNPNETFVPMNSNGVESLGGNRVNYRVSIHVMNQLAIN